MDIGKFFRGATLYFLSAAIFFLLFTLAYFIVFSRITANPDKVKQVLSTSGVYQKAPAVIYDNITTQNTNSQDEDIPLKAPIVRRAVLSSVTPVFLQNTAETAIDGVYGWLQGKQAQPSFKIKFDSVRQNLAGSLSSQIGQRLKKLPVCSAGSKASGSNFSPYTSPCRPAGIDIHALQNSIKKSVLKADFLKDADISPVKLKDQSGKPVLADESNLPNAYKAALKMPYFLAAGIILLSAVVVFISKTRAEGFKRLAVIFGLSGVFALMLPLVIEVLTNAFLHAAATEKVVTELAGPVLSKLNVETAKVYYVTGGVYIVLAAGSFLLFRRLRIDLPPKKAVK